MRSLVLFLALSVSPVGAVVCEVACAMDHASHEHAHSSPHHHHQTEALVAIASPADDHDCDHPDSGPAVLGTPVVATADRSVVALPAQYTESPNSSVAFLNDRPIATSWSPPHSPPLINPLRI